MSSKVETERREYEVVLLRRSWLFEGSVDDYKGLANLLASEFREHIFIRHEGESDLLIIKVSSQKEARSILEQLKTKYKEISGRDLAVNPHFY